MMRLFLRNTRGFNTTFRSYATVKHENSSPSNKFETVFRLPSIKYFALVNRLKVYHVIGTSLAIPGCGLLETMNIVPAYSSLTATYMAMNESATVLVDTFEESCFGSITGLAVLSLASIPFRNIIGFLYISEDNKQIKISAIDYWGKRNDRIIPADDWIPLLDMKPKTTDALFLTPHLSDGTKYKLLVRFGNVLNAQKMGQVLE